METKIWNTTVWSRERVSAWGLLAARVSFALLLICSASMWQWLDVQRRVPPVYSGYTDFFVYPSDVFLVLTIVFGLLGIFISKRKITRGPWYLTLPLGALVLLSFVSTLASVDAELTLYHSLRWLVLFGLYLVLCNLALPAKWIVLPLALGVLVQGGVGILQFIRQSSLGLQFLGELHLDPLETGASILRYDDVRILRAYGLTDHPNLLGGFLAFALIFILGYYFALANSASRERRARFLWLLPFGVGILALFYTFSRAAQLAFFLGVVVLFVASLREPTQRSSRVREWFVLALLVGGVLAVPFVNNQRLIAQRVGQDNAFSENVGEARSLDERDELTNSANRLFYAHQLWGVGNGALTLAMYYLDKEFPKDVYYYQPVHFVLLVAATELGLVGGFFWLWVMVAPLIAMWVRRTQLIQNPWVAAMAAGIVVMLVIGFFDYYPWLWQAGRLWQWSAWGLFAAIFSSRQLFDANAPAQHPRALNSIP